MSTQWENHTKSKAPTGSEGERRYEIRRETVAEGEHQE
jgi:hypothetical protein